MRARVLSLVVAAGLCTGAGPAVADDHAVTYDCSYQATAVPNSNNLVVAVAGYAVATTHPGVAATGIRCVLKGTFTGTVYYDSTVTTPGPVSVLTGSVTIPAAALTICAQGSAAWLDGHTRTGVLVCH